MNTSVSTFNLLIENINLLDHCLFEKPFLDIELEAIKYQGSFKIRDYKKRQSLIIHLDLKVQCITIRKKFLYCYFELIFEKIKVKNSDVFMMKFLNKRNSSKLLFDSYSIKRKPLIG